MPEQQSSSRQKKARSGSSKAQQQSTRTSRSTAEQKLDDYKTSLKDIHDLLLTENKLREVLLDPQRVPTFQNTLSDILAWIKTVEQKDEIINSFTNVLEGREIGLFKEAIEKAIFHCNVVMDLRIEEIQAKEENNIEAFRQFRYQAYATLKDCRTCIQQALRLFK